MAFHVTQCPGCESTFNTSARVLQTAAGRVRCGACLTVFTAAENFISTNDGDPEDEADSSVFVGNNPADYFDPSLFLTRQSLTAEDDPDDAGEAPVFGASLDADIDAGRAAFAAPPAVGAEPRIAVADDEVYFDLADDALDADSGDQAGPSSEPAADESPPRAEADAADDLQMTPDAEADADSGREPEHSVVASPPTAFAATAPDLDVPEVSADAYSAFEIVTEVEADDGAPPPDATEVPPPATGHDDTGADSTAAIRARALRAQLQDEEALEALPAETRSAIGRILPPVELLAGSEARWGRRITMTLGCVLLGALLALQVLWQQLPAYSLLPRLRPLYEFGCEYLHCVLPPFVDIAAIRSDTLQVRSHPARDDALSVSLSFRNTAAFPQAFPILILSFNSASNAIIALREFAPEEYLDEGLRGIAEMPVLSPVQVELEIMDPGADALNYTVAFRRP